MKILFNRNAVKYETKKAVLIKVPRQNCKVWLPKSLIKPKMWFYSAYLPKDMEFTLLIGRNSKKRCSAQTLQNFFEGQIFSCGTEKTEVYYHKPKKFKPKKVEADDSLKR
ncbi:MAG TPA: hypothetical protein DG851_05790 [Lactobacillus acetotolerans]|jgi:hypothetical protein|nr:hypothetical protein [Lactobacillus acetotolerans]